MHKNIFNRTAGLLALTAALSLSACSNKQTETTALRFDQAVDNYDFQNYQPPQQFGQITKKNFPNPKGKTVIIIPDMHAKNAPILQDGIPKEADQVQTEIYFLVKDILTKQKKLAIVREGHPITDPPTDLAYLKAHPEAINEPIHHDIIGADMLTKRSEIAEKALKHNNQLNTAPLLGLVFQDQLTIVGDLKEEDFQARIRQIARARIFETTVQKTPEIFCGPLYPNVDWNALDKQHTFQMARFCTCQMEQIRSKLYHELFSYRCNQDAEKEANIAANVPENNVLLITGAMHADKQVEVLKQQKINYLIIEPPTLSQLVSGTDGLCKRALEMGDQQSNMHKAACEDIPQVSSATERNAKTLLDQLVSKKQ